MVNKSQERTGIMQVYRQTKSLSEPNWEWGLGMVIQLKHQ